MAVVKKANTLSQVVYMVQEVCSNVQKKLYTYCKQRAVEVGLVSKTFPHDLTISSDAIETRKTILKLKTLLFRYVVKTTPFISFAINEFLEVKDRELLLVNLGVSGIQDTLSPAVNWEPTGLPNPTIYHVQSNSVYKYFYIRNHPDTKWIYRYCRYLTYLCKKYHLPIFVEPNIAIEFNYTDVATIKSLGSVARAAFKMRHTISYGIRFRLVKWVPRSVTTYEKVLAGTINGEYAKYFSSEENLVANNLLASSDVEVASAYRYSPAKIFLHMDKIMKVFMTLTRKAEYGLGAFSFRNNEDS